MKARILEVSESEYHHDEASPVPTLSHSIAHIMVTQSPAHAWLAHPRLGGKRREMTDAMLEGAILHKLLLNAGPEIRVINADNYKTKVAQADRIVALAEGFLPILAGKYEQLMYAAHRLRSNCFYADFPLTGRSEVAIEWEVDDVLCRCKIDHLKDDEPDCVHIYDIKKCHSCNPDAIMHTAYKYGWDIQDAAYTEAVHVLTGRAGVRMTFLCCETVEPYSVVPITLDRHFKRIGMQRWTRACHNWEQCLLTDKWPGYQATVISPPSWVEHMLNWEQEEAVAE